MLDRHGIYVDGRWQPASSSDVFEVINPHSEEIVGTAAMGAASDVDVAVRSSANSLSGPWADMSLDERCAIVERVASSIAERQEELATYQTSSMGAVYKSALGLGGSLELIDMYLESVREVRFSYLRRDRFGNTLITRQPVGVVGAIVPWNAPLRSEVKKTIPALLAGCAVVLKPAPETPFGAFAFAEICSDAGVPPGVVNVVPGGPPTGEALVQHPLVRKVAFTGSTATGARIASLAGPSFKRLQLELGGKSAAIVLDDADLAAVMPVLVAGNWGNSGQTCTAITRVFAPARRYDEVVEAFVDAARQRVVGDPMDPATMMGPLVAARQRERVLGLIDAGIDEGAKLVAGGGRPSHLPRGYYVEPTVFADVNNSMRIAQEEIFGPVTSVIRYESEDEAVSMANDSPYGLHGAVFARDETHALAVARRLDTGSVAINRFYLAASAPFGGVKASGIGREHGPEGYDSFLEYISYNISSELAERLSPGGDEG